MVGINGESLRCVLMSLLEQSAIAYNNVLSENGQEQALPFYHSFYDKLVLTQAILKRMEDSRYTVKVSFSDSSLRVNEIRFFVDDVLSISSTII